MSALFDDQVPEKKQATEQQEITVDEYKFEALPPIKGFPELRWRGKMPYNHTRFFPAQKKESYGSADESGWINKIFWGDNLQVMSHLLKKYRGKVDLIYIDPPFDSKAEYKKTIKLKGKDVSNNLNAFEEKQYADMWNNDEYLQFMYERLIIMRELLSDTGSIYLHCDWHKAHHLRCIMDEVFGTERFVNEITWKRTFAHGDMGQGAKHLGRISDYIFIYTKSENYLLNQLYTPYEDSYIKKHFSNEDPDGRRWQSVSLTAPGGASKGNPYYEFLGVKRYWQYSQENMKKLYESGHIYQSKEGNVPRKKMYLDESKGIPLQDIWTDIVPVQGGANENENYPTQKPEELLKRIIEIGSNKGDLIFDCFMGSGTTQAVAMKLGRRFIGADINLGAIETTVKRLNKILKDDPTKPGFEVYNVNNYDVFRNPVEAKNILRDALEITPLDRNVVFDGEKDGWMVKIMPVNRIANREDLNDIINNVDYAALERARDADPTKPAMRINLVCMGHEADLGPELVNTFKNSGFDVEVKVSDILRNNKEIEFKRSAEAFIVRDGNKLVVKGFYPMNLLQKLSIQREHVEDWKELVTSIKIDWNYDGGVFEPAIVDYPESKQDLVQGIYEIPADAGKIKIKITDLLDESFEQEL